MFARNSVLSACIAVGLTIALLAQPVAAAPAAQAQPTPTPTPASDVLIVSPDNVPVISPAQSNPIIGDGTLVVTQQTWNPTDPAALISQPTTSPLAVVSGCGGPTHIFQSCPINMPGGPDNETVLERQAIGSVLQQHALPAGEATRVMHNARNSVRAALFTYLAAAFAKSPGSRSAAEQAAVDAFTKLVRQKHVQAAKIAQAEYTKWASNPCGYTPPAGFSYSAASACLGASQLFTPQSPGLKAFQAYGAAGAYQTSQIDAAAAHLYGATSNAALLGYGYAAALGAGATATYIGTMVPLAIFDAVFPFAVGGAGATIAGASGDVGAAIGASAPAGVTGAAAIGGTVLIVVAAVVTGVVAGISVFTEAAIPGQLQDALTAAQAYDIGPGITSADAGTRTAAVQELYAAFMQSTQPEFASTDAVPTPQPSDPQFVVQGQKTSTLQYTAWDGSHHTARLSGGWMVDAPDGGSAALALFIQVLDPAGATWIASPVGTQFVAVNMTDPADASAPAPTLTTDLTLKAWSGQPITARLASAGEARLDLVGARVRAPSDPAIYLIDATGSKRHVPDPTTYNNLFRDWASVRTLDLGGIASGAELTRGAYLALAQETRDRVYLVDNNQKRWVTSPAVMDRFDFNYATIRQVPQSTLDALPDGTPLT